jgi:signal transduction histidine kinase
MNRPLFDPAPDSDPATAANDPLAGAASREAATGIDSLFELARLDRPHPQRHNARWMGWRLRLLVGAALLGCLGILLLARWTASQPTLDAIWRLNAQAAVELTNTGDPLLKPHVGAVLVALTSQEGHRLAIEGLALQRSARWMPDDVQRERHLRLHDQLARALGGATVQLHFSDGSTESWRPTAGGIASLGLLFWLLAALALALYMVAMVVVLSRPSRSNLAYAVMAFCQAGNLLFLAVESASELTLPGGLAPWDLQARVAFDLLTGAALVHAFSRYPHRLPVAREVSVAAWGVVIALCAANGMGVLPHAWWWAQLGGAALGASAIGLLTWSYRLEPHPFSVVLRRFGIVNVATWMLLTLTVALAGTQSGLQQTIVSVGPMIWYVFFSSILLLVPFLSRSQQLMREFSLLAGVSTVATALDLLFVAVFSFGQFTSLTLSLFLSLAAYSGARQWVLNHLLGSNMLTMERLFERLYRMAREVEANPQRTPHLLSRLLRELFEPLEAAIVQRSCSGSRIGGDGSTLLVPIPDLMAAHPASHGVVVIRYAHRGRRLFTPDDARLTDRIVEQLRRAVAFDKAVEQGRSEERARIAQDLHDDIGARLLTLMYKAPTPEMEDYVRHTLQDLKTLTRGLAAHSHRLSHAAAEWKADLTQRLLAVHCELVWSLNCDQDVDLGVVQWSALTRVLRELVTNVITHARATRVEIALQLERDRLDVLVRDNGLGRDPKNWAQGLGLGGVRKRVKQLGGTVEWREVNGSGIECRVRIPDVSQGR